MPESMSTKCWLLNDLITFNDFVKLLLTKFKNMRRRQKGFKILAIRNFCSSEMNSFESYSRIQQ